MTEPELYTMLTGVFCRIFGREDIVLHADTTAQDVEGWDSFKQIDIIMAVEEALETEFSPRDINNLRSVGDLVTLALSQGGARP